MRLVILDYHGTLSCHNNPKELVTKLRARGDCVVMWSGGGRDIPPELMDLCTYVISKYSTLKEVFETVQAQPAWSSIKPTEVFISDDDVCEALMWCIEDRGFHYIDPKELDTLLN